MIPPRTKFLQDYQEQYRTDRCLACDAQLGDDLAGPSAIWTDDLSQKVGFYACPACGMAYAYPFLPDTRVAQLYQDYSCHHIHEQTVAGKRDFLHKIQVWYEDFVAPIFFRSSRLRIKKFLSCFLFQRMVQSYPIFSSSKAGSLRILDVGCGDGHFLLSAQRFGWSVFGLEIHQPLVERLRASGIEATDNLPDWTHERFDVIRINHVLEHLRNPDNLLASIRPLLTENGELIIGVPNSDTPARVFGEHLWCHLPYHRFIFNRAAITCMLARYGFQVVLCRTKSMGVLTLSLIRRYPPLTRLLWPLRLIDLIISPAVDLLQKGDCLEIHARLAPGQVQIADLG